MIYAAIFLGSQQHARISGMNGKGEHAPAEARNRCSRGIIRGTLQGSQIGQQIFCMVRAYGPYDESRSACWATIAAASTSQAMIPMSPQLLVG